MFLALIYIITFIFACFVVSIGTVILGLLLAYALENLSK